jgi:hypothetical protein
MTISIDKLEQFLFRQNIMITKIFLYRDDSVRFIEIFMFDIAELVIINTKKYKIEINKKYEIEYISKNNSDYTNFIDDFSNDEIRQEFEDKQYNEINIKYKENGNIEKHMKNRYDRPIYIKDNNKVNKSLIRQTNRISLCLKAINYDICLSSNRHIYLKSTRNNKISIYDISNIRKSEKIKLYITIDLDYLYSNIQNTNSDIKDIKQQLLSIFTSNFNHYVSVFKCINVSKDTVKNNVEKIIKKSKEYLDRISSINSYVFKLTEEERKLIDEKQTIQPNGKSIYIYSKASQIANIDAHISTIRQKKKEQLRSIIEILYKLDTLILPADMILFDAAVMIETANKNINNLNDI